MALPGSSNQYPWHPPPSSRGTWPPPAGPGGGMPFPSSYPHPPPMPAGFSYGKRAWMNGTWVMAPDEMRFGARRGPPRGGGSASYWATELKDNPLGLENMIPAEKLQIEDAKNDPSQSGPVDGGNMIWVPALTDDDPRGRMHHRTFSSSSRSSSQPENRHHYAGRDRKDSSPPPPLPVPPLTPYHRDGRGPYNSVAAQDRTRPQSSAAYHRRSVTGYDREQRGNSGRMSVPADSLRNRNNERYGSAPPMSAPAAQRSQQQHSLDSDSDTTSTQRPQSRGIPPLRSHTMPPEDIHRRQRQHESTQRNLPYSSANVHYPRQGSSVASGSRSIARSHTLPAELAYPKPTHVHGVGSREHSPQHDRFQQQDQYSPNNIYAPPRQRPEDHRHSSPHTRIPTPEPEEGELEAPDPKSVARVRKWLEKNDSIARGSPVARRTVDGYEHSRRVEHRDTDHSPGVPITSLRRGDDVARSASLPAVIPMAHPRASFSTTNDVRISEEPSDIIPGLAGMAVGNEDEYIGPGEYPPRNRGLERTDTLVINNIHDQHESLLPSPQSLQRNASQSSRAPSTRSSYDHGYPHSANVQLSPKRSFGSGGSHSRLVSPASSLHFHKQNDMTANTASYHTPPITPNKPNYVYQQNETKSPYSMKSASASRSSIAISAANSPVASPYRRPDVSHHRTGSAQPTYQTPERLQYLYQQDTGGSSSSPHSSKQQHVQAYHTPQRHHAVSRTQQQDAEYLQQVQQRGTGKGRSALASRSPSPNSAYQRHGGHSMPSRAIASQNASPSHARGHGRVPEPIDMSNMNSPPTAERRAAPRNIRIGLWNRRGDHLTEDGYVVYCPPGRNYPRDLANYPEDAFMDHTGRTINERPDAHTEHPDSIPKGCVQPVKPYDMFINFTLVN